MKHQKLLCYGFMQPSDWTCAPAAARIILHNLGVNQDIKSIAREMKTNTGSYKGTTEHNMIKFFKKWDVKFHIKRNASINDMKERLKNGRILMACYWIPFYKEFHVAIVSKITSKRIHFHDTWFGSSHSYALDYFKRQWAKDDNWLMTVKRN